MAWQAGLLASRHLESHSNPIWEGARFNQARNRSKSKTRCKPRFATLRAAYSAQQHTMQTGASQPLSLKPTGTLSRRHTAHFVSAIDTYDGYHVGGGLEGMIGSHATVRVEYRYTEYGGEDWDTGGFIDVAPSTHTGTMGVSWLF